MRRLIVWIQHLVLKWLASLRWKPQTAAEQEESRERYLELVDTVNRHHAGIIESIHDRIVRVMERIGEIFRQMVASVTKSKEAELELDGLTQLISAHSQKSASEFDDLVAIPGVNRMEFEQHMIRVITNPIFIAHGGRRYNLGIYAIEIVDNTSIRVRCLTPTGAEKRFDHPHIEEGMVKMPLHIHRSVVKLIIGLEYADVTQLILNLLNNYDPNTCVVRIEQNWKGESS